MTYRLFISICFVILSAACHPNKRGEPLNENEKVRFVHAELIGRALVLFARDHAQTYPRSLDDLVPGYIGTNIPTTQFEIYSTANPQTPPHALVAQERLPPERRGTERTLLIRADGRAYFLDPGN